MKKRSAKEIFAQTLLELSRRAPLDKITVKQIVAESGLSLQTFYNHFSDKYELIVWIHQSESDRLVSRLGHEGYGFYDLLRDYARFYAEQREFFLNALANTHGPDSYGLRSGENSYRVLGDYICARCGLARLPEDVDIYLKMYVCATSMVLADWTANASALSPETLALYLAQGMPEGLKPYLLEDGAE